MKVRGTGGSPGTLWALNAATLLELLVTHEQLARPDLTKLSGLSRTTVAQIIEVLTERGIVTIAGEDHSRRGPSASLYSLNNNWQSILVISIDRSYVVAHEVDLCGSIQAEARIAFPDNTAHIADLVALISGLRARLASTRPAGAAAPDAVYIGVPAVVTPGEQTLRLAEALPEDGVGFASAVERALELPVTLENDVNLAAIAELAFAPESALTDFVYLSLGDAAGAAIVLNGELRRGRRGGAGEIAYLPGAQWEDQGGLGRPAMTYDTAEVGLPALTAEEIFALAAQGDAGARAVVVRTAERVASVVATVSLVIDPEAVVLGGTIGRHSELLPAVRAVLDLHYPSADIDLMLTRVDDDASRRGAISAALTQMRASAFNTVCQQPPSSDTTNKGK